MQEPAARHQDTRARDQDRAAGDRRVRALLLAVLSLLSLLSPCERTRALVCRNPPLAVEPAVEQPPLEAQLRQKEALSIAAIAHIKELETKHTAELTMLIDHIFVQGVYEWAKCFAAMLDFQGKFEDIEHPFGEGTPWGSLSGDTNPLQYDGAIDDWLTTITGHNNSGYAVAARMLFEYGRLPMGARHVSSRDWSEEEEAEWEDDAKKYYWPERGTDFQRFSRLLGANPWQDAAAEFIRPPIELAVDDLDTDATDRPWSPP